MACRLPLEGLRVVAVEQAVAAPFCTSRLADAGADVIKVERPEGDFARAYDKVAADQSSYFVWLNRGKKSVVLDLASDVGKARLTELVTRADVLVQNLKPGAFSRLGFPPDVLLKQHPRLIICSISGYGETGPMAERKAYDLLIQAESGLASITGRKEEPARVGISIADIATGATAHSAILEALIQRSITGEGAHIQISMFDVMADWMTVPLLHQEGGNPPRPIGLSHPSIAPYGVFFTADSKPILLSVQSDREWAVLASQLLEDVALISDPRFSTNVQRVAHRLETDRIVAKAFAALDEAEMCQRLASADLAFARLNNIEDLSKHPHLRRITVDTANGPVSYPAPAAIFIGKERAYGSVPALGSTKVDDSGALQADNRDG